MRTPVSIMDNRTREPVEAQLFDEVTVAHFIEAQAEWRPVVLDAARAMLQAGVPREQIPQHFHWDWQRKEQDLRLLAVTFYGLEQESKLQGLIKLLTASQQSRIPAQRGKPLVYIDYLETAPWNIKPLMQALGREARYAAVGTRLMEAAVRLSLDEGFKGRVGLHSLPLSEGFYLRTCGMTPVERDALKGNMLWYEFTPEQAQQFLTGGTV